MSIPAIEDIYEAYSDELGSWMGLLISGHHDDETATALAWWYIDDNCIDAGTIGHPERCWVRKVPRPGYMAYHYQSYPERGASPVTRIEEASGWQYWCDAPRCRWQFVPRSATTGVARAQIINGSELGRQEQRADRDYVYLCRDHANRYHEDLKVARKAAMERYYAERNAS